MWIENASAAIPAAIAALLGAVAVREAMLGSPAALGWVRAALEPLRRAGREGYAPTGIERRRLGAFGAAALAGAGWLVAGPGPAPALALAGPAVAGAAIARRERRYRRGVERRLPDLALAIADALATGRSPQGSLLVAGRALEGPVAVEMARVCADLELGASTTAAVTGLQRRMRSPRVDGFAAALLASRLAGADLALLLRRHAEAAVEQERASEDARAATAQARFTGLLVVAMPAGGALFAELVRPGFVAGILAQPIATGLLVAAGMLQLFGLWAVRRLSAVVG